MMIKNRPFVDAYLITGGVYVDDYQRVIVSKNVPKEVALVFENMRFPKPLFDMTKHDEILKYKEWNAEDVLSKIWFCYRPVDGKPCGLCDPCKTYIEVGLESMIPRNRMRLYNLRKNNEGIFSFMRKVKYGLNKFFKK